MLAFEVQAQGAGGVVETAPPVPGVGEVVIDVALCGICGTDTSLFAGDARRYEIARSTHPLRLGHEWTGTVASLGRDVDDAWLGTRVVGDSMIGCGRCDRCLDGRHHVCEDRYEVGVRRGRPGALAEQLLMPVSALHVLPDTVSDRVGALVEPGANAWRAVQASGAASGRRVLVLGPGTIGLLCVQFAIAAGAEVHVLGLTEPSLDLALRLGARGAWTWEALPMLAWDAVIDATDSRVMPALAVELVEPGRRVVLIGIAHEESVLDSRQLAFKDLTVIGILGGSAGIAPTIEAYAAGVVDPLPLIGATIGLGEVESVLAGRFRPDPAGGPKVLVDPSR